MMRSIALASLFAVFTHVKSQELQLQGINKCPPWTVRINGTAGCTCADSLKGTVNCDGSRGAYSLSKCFCMTTSHGDAHLPVVGPCMYHCDIIFPTWYTLATNITLESIDESTCGPYNRTGVICSKCVEGYGLPVYSYSVACVKCHHYWYNWLKYVAVAYLPLTAFYILIIALRISATSGSAIGYITLCQLLTARTFAILMFNISRFNIHTYTKYFITFLSIWNLDFFRAFYAPFCIHPRLSALQVLSLDYIVAIYPMVLILFTFLLVKLHSRYPVIEWLCKPFHRCLHYFKKEWYVNNSLIESFSTFYFLSYVKILNVSVDILTPTHRYSMNGGKSSTMYVYYNASLPYFGKEHLPFAIIAIVVAVVFNILPLLLLFLYPFSTFHTCLNKLRFNPPQALHTFMDSILGSYKQERRYFGAIYPLLRFVLLSSLASLTPLMYVAAAAFYLIVAVVSVALLMPYRNACHSATDIVLLFSSLTGSLMMIFYREGMMVAPAEAEPLRHTIYNPIGYIAMAFVPVYGFALYFWRILPEVYITKKVKKLVTWAKNYFKEEGDIFEEYSVNNEERPLLNHF